MSHPLATRPARAIFTLSLLIAAPYLVPARTELLRWHGKAIVTADRLRLLSPRQQEPTPTTVVNEPNTEMGQAVLTQITNDDGETEHPGVPSKPARAAPLFGGQRVDERATAHTDTRSLRPIEDPSGQALVPFFESLAAVEQKQANAITRVVYYGDSVVAIDWVTTTLRRKFQDRFGDAGHGFVLPANAWPGYSHNDVKRFASKGWKMSSIVGPYAPDGRYGLGGVSFVADGPGIFASVNATKRVSQFVITYEEGPGGGDLALQLDAENPQVISTNAPDEAPKAITLSAPDGPHKLSFRTLTTKPVRLFGVDLERAGPGVIVDALGVVGCRFRFLDKFDDTHWAYELKRRHPSLIVFAYGANESEDGFAYPMDQYESSARAILKQVREALPHTTCLLVGPLDRVDKKDDRYITREVIPAINQIQRKLSEELGCAFFDTFQAMGGPGSMGKWFVRGLGSADFVHPTYEGADLIGTWLFEALMEGYSAYQTHTGTFP